MTLLAIILGGAAVVFLITVREWQHKMADIRRKSFGEGVLHLKDIVEGDDR